MRATRSTTVAVVSTMAMVAMAAIAAGPAAAKGSAAPPPQLLGSITLGARGGLDGLRAYVDAVKPGAGAAMNDAMIAPVLAQLAGAQDLSGLDAAAPRYLLVVDTGGAIPGVVALGKVADDAALTQGAGAATITRKGGWAVIGLKSLADPVAAYALDTIARAPAPQAPTATAYLPAVRARYGAQLQAWRDATVAGLAKAPGGAAMGGFATMYVDGLLAMLADSDRAVVTVVADQDEGAFDLALVPRAKTSLAAFVAAQRPSDFALLADLPAASAMVFAGHFDSGPYRAGVLAAMSQVYSPGSPSFLLDTIKGLMKAASGEFAMTVGLGGGQMTMAEVAAMTDPRAAAKEVGALFTKLASPASFDSMGVPTTIAATASSTHDGVTLYGTDTTYDLSKATAEQRAAMQRVAGGKMHGAMAVFDKLLVWTGGGDADQTAGQVIDLARGHGAAAALPPDAAALVAAAAADHDSVLMIFDFGALAALGGKAAATIKAGSHPMMMMSLGFADRAAHVRFTLPTATMRAIAAPPPPPSAPASAPVPRRYQPHP